MGQPEGRSIGRRAAAAVVWPAHWRQFGRFLVVGAIGFGINAVLFAFLVHVGGVDFRGAAVLSNSVALTSNFVLNRRSTFTASGQRATVEATRFALVSLVGFAVNIATLQAAVQLAHLPKLSSEIIASAVAAPVNFVGNRQWSFRGASAPS